MLDTPKSHKFEQQHAAPTNPTNSFAQIALLMAVALDPLGFLRALNRK